jgi:hypothetical protein
VAHVSPLCAKTCVVANKNRHAAKAGILFFTKEENSPAILLRVLSGGGKKLQSPSGNDL